MKRAISVLLSLALLLGLLPACAQTAAEPEPPAEEPEAAIAARELAETVLPASGRAETLDVERLNADEDGARLAAYIEAVCGLTGEQWEDAAVIRGMGASAFEIIVLRLGNEEAAGKIETVLTEYLTVREGAFTGYAPAEAEMASKGKVRREAQYVGLFICPDPAGAEAMFSAACKGEEPPPLPEPEPEPVEEPETDGFTPAFEIQDLLHRLLVEAACPDWFSLDAKTRGWSDSKIAGRLADEAQAKYGLTTDQFEVCGCVYWGPQFYEAVGDVSDPTIIARNVHEVTVFQTATEDGARELAQALSDYKAIRLEQLEQRKVFTDETMPDFAQTIRQNAEEEAETLADAQVVSSGHYAALIVSEYAENAVRLFPRIVNDPATSGCHQRYLDGIEPAAVADPDPDYPDRVRFTPPGEEDMSIYDTSTILAAWEAGNPSGLSGDDAAIYDAAEEILAEIIRDGMTDLEKEAAAYRWLVNNVNYDWSHQDVLEETDRRSYGPYGGLVNRAAVCLGYAASFQLLMDMSGVECVTVVGAAFNSTGDHAWNMVRLGGEWYCVDVTWDANAREQFNEEREWRYFNLTSDEMAANHQWDYANTPEATAEDRGGAA